MPDHPNLSDETIDYATFLNALAMLSVVMTTVIAWQHPFGDESILSPRLILAWIAAQSLILVSVGWLLGRMGVRFHRRWLVAVGMVGIIAVPTIVLCDAITFGWTHDRFLSPGIYRIASELRAALWQHVGSGTFRTGILLLVGWSGCVSGLLATSWFAAKRNVLHRDAWLAGFASVCLASAAPMVATFDTTLVQMRMDSSRHPLCAFRMIAYDDVGSERAGKSATKKVSTDDKLRLAIKARGNQQRLLRASTHQETHPDVVIVVIESFRHELVCEEVMPHLWEFARRGLHCRQHVSGGNATNHGMFSLLNGLEAIWYDSDCRYTPLLNRLMREAGYEIGFFAGHDDWRLFQMDGYISPEQFDVFQISKRNGLRSDRLATQRAANFLGRLDLRGSDAPHRPRLAVLYLYATHADYHSYAEDQIFQPAADDRFLIPFTRAMRDQVWNRYKNSARSVDRFLSAVMRDDRIVIVTGDHGESFLEDGVCGHGIRISKVQNMTPAVFYRPGGDSREFDVPTMHADLLPTLLSALEISLSDSNSLDGVDLAATDESTFRDRTLTTRNYLNDDVAVIVSSENADDQPFAYRGKFSIRDAAAIPLNPIDDAGQQIEQNPDQTRKWWDEWLRLRFKGQR